VVAFPAHVFENTVLQPGDVIGAFTMDGLCAGRLEIKNTKSNAALMLFGNDEFTPAKDGFDEDEPFAFKVYRPESDEIFEVGTDFDLTMPNTGYFTGHGISAISSLKLQSTGITEISNISMEVYPNPSKDIFNVRINKTLENPRIQISDFRGSLVKKMNLGRINNGESVEFDLSELPNGVYFLKLKDEGFVGMVKIIINN
jgi:hypothetical protein